jgi:hypothetical protein
MPSDRLRGSRERTKRHRLVLGIEQTIELSPACLHARRKFGFGNFLTLHQFTELSSQHTLDRPRGHAFIDTVLLQKIIEGRPDFSFPDLSGLLQSISLFRLTANSRSLAGVFCVFLMKACSNTILPSCSQNSTRTANFPQPSPERTAERHTDRPCELNILDIFADDLAIIGG